MSDFIDYVPKIRLYATADWRFVLEDVRDASGAPLDLSGYSVKVSFRHASLRNFIIDELDEDNGITITPGSVEEGPTITILSRACNRAWRPILDTAVVGDIMMTSGTSPNATSKFIQRISFIALWGSTQD